MKKVLLIFIIFLSVIGIISLTGLDIKLSSLMYSASNNPSWIYSNGALWKFMYHYGNILPNACGIGCAIILLISLFIKNSSIFSKENKKRIFLALLLFLVAPGLITQTLKVTWGRPRPVEIKEFGGNHEFRTPFEPNFALFGNKTEGNSFPSGHAANAFYMIFPYYVAKNRKALIFGTLGLCYGILMSLTRIIQGGHFLSDVVTSLFIVYITAEALKLLLINRSIKE